MTDSRLGSGITGTSTSIITAAEIARSPNYTLTDILSRETGVQTQNLFGGVNGARSSVDMRGFGQTAASNTLILVNGRRLYDLDQQVVDFAALPLASIDRIEITRGNSGAVLYGDGAVGGVINIVTKTGVNLPPSARIEGAFGSYAYREGSASASVSSGPFAASVYGNAIGSDSYRMNNAYKQYNGVGDFRYTTDRGSLYLTLMADDQMLGLPGHRRVEPSKGINQVVTDPRGAATPFDYGNKQGQSLTAGATAMLWPGAEVIVDGGVRQKKQQGGFFDTTTMPGTVLPLNYVDATLTTTSFTPRIKVDGAIAGMPWKSITGVDWYRAEYESPRSLGLGDPPKHFYDLAQTSYAAYSQHTLTVFRDTDVAVGGRIQRTGVRARDTFDPTAPGACPFFFCGDPAGIPYDANQTNRAYHIGIEHRINTMVALFARHAQSFRVPNVDERVGAVTAGIGDPTNFSLRTQKSHDWEGGVRIHAEPFDVQWSIYDMDLTDEIHFHYGPNFIVSNTNLDPTRRYGNETIASWQVTENVRLRGGYAYTRAVFREGIFAGNDVPLVSRHTANATASWNIVGRQLVFDGTVRYVGARRMDNDQINLQPLIPAFTMVDVRLGGEMQNFFWSASILNLFDKHYFDYAIASPYPFGFQSAIGTYNAYPQPGRTFMVRAGLRY